MPFSLALILATSLTLRLFAAADDGIGIDPNGGARNTATIDHRCTIDPNGGPCPADALTDRGAGLDPDGQ